MKRQAAVVVAATLIAIGIVHARTTQNRGDEAKPLPPGTIRITPIDLFPGDLKRLQPHLEMDGACFRFEFEDPQRSARVVLQILERGKREVRSTLFLTPRDGLSSGEVSISVRSVNDGKGPAAWHVIAHLVQERMNGLSSASQTISKTLLAKANASFGKSIDVVSDFDINKDVVLWSIVQGGRPIPQMVSVDELAAAADRAVVLRLVSAGAE